MRAVSSIFLSLAFMLQGQTSACLINHRPEKLHVCCLNEAPVETNCCCDESKPFDQPTCKCHIGAHAHQNFFQLADDKRILVPDPTKQAFLQLTIKQAYPSYEQSLTVIEAPPGPKTSVQFSVWRL